MKKSSLFFYLTLVLIFCCKSKTSAQTLTTAAVEASEPIEITDVEVKSRLDALMATMDDDFDRVDDQDQNGYYRVCADVEGWQKIIELWNKSTFFMDASESGYWYSDGIQFDVVGSTHRDGRHPFPNRNSMALVVAVQTVSTGQVKYYFFSRDQFGNLKDIQIGIRNGIVRVYGMVNDWQSRGLADNSGCLKVYAAGW